MDRRVVRLAGKNMSLRNRSGQQQNKKLRKNQRHYGEEKTLLRATLQSMRFSSEERPREKISVEPGKKTAELHTITTELLLTPLAI